MYDSSKAASSRPGAKSGEKPIPSAWPIPIKNSISTFEHHSRVDAHEVPISTPHLAQPTVRTFAPREEASIPFFARSSSEPRKVRSSFDFQKWVKKFNELGDPYHHLANFQ